jgi:hypothetical protein
MNCTNDKNKLEIFIKYDKIIDNLYEFRDKYYLTNGLSKTSEDRISDLTVKLNQFISDIETVQNQLLKAQYLVLLGRARNVMPDYDQMAFDYLSKAIKIDPKCIEAWNYLGKLSLFLT